MPKLFFGNWEPDKGLLNSGTVITATGMLPLLIGYGPWRQCLSYSQAVPSQPFGGTVSRTKVGVRHVWTGDATKLYRLDRTDLGWDDYSRVVGGAYAASVAERWIFRQFGTNLIAFQINDVPQVIDVEAGTNFADLGGSPPRARFGDIVKDFFMFGNIFNSPDEVYWSGSNNIAQWTIGSNQSDHQILPDGGPVTGILGGETAFIIQEEAVRRAAYVGPPTIFQIDKIMDKRGCKAPWSMVRAGDVAFFLSPEGFCSLSIQGQSTLIDHLGGWSEFFAADVDINRINRTRGVVDPLQSRVFWLYHSRGSADNYDTVLCWDYGINKATICRVTLVEGLVSATAPFTLEGLDVFGSLDSLGFSLDDESLQGDTPQFGAFNAAFKLGSFSGTAQEATIETADYELSDGHRSFVGGVIPLVDNANSLVSLGTRTVPSSSKVYTAETLPHSRTGKSPFRSDARYHSFRLRVPAGETWTRIQGVDPTVIRTGQQ